MGWVMPRSGRTGVASRGLRLRAAARLQSPRARGMPTVQLRRLAMGLGPVPVRTWQVSSAKIVSRIWCNVDRVHAFDVGRGVATPERHDRHGGLSGRYLAGMMPVPQRMDDSGMGGT
jgi:hypothetical protein